MNIYSMKMPCIIWIYIAWSALQSVWMGSVEVFFKYVYLWVGRKRSLPNNVCIYIGCSTKRFVKKYMSVVKCLSPNFYVCKCICDINPHGKRADLGLSRIKLWWKMRKLIKERMENKVVNFVGLSKVVLGIKWMNGMVKREILIPGDRCRTGCHDITLQNMQIICVRMNRLNK